MSDSQRVRRTKSQKQKSLAGNHQRCWLWGRNAVLEALRFGKWLPLELVISEQLAPELRQEVLSLARDAGIATQTATPERLTELCHSREHQGFIAKMPPFPYLNLSDILSSSMHQQAPAPLFVLLDSVQDPFNFGAICRSACVFGATAVIVARQSQVEVTSHVARSSAGAINRIPIVQVDDLATAIAELRSRAVRIYATTITAKSVIGDINLAQPSGLLIGNEGQGVQPQLIAACDGEVTIPQATSFDSLNAAVAAGVVLYESYRQRLPGSSSRPLAH